MLSQAGVCAIAHGVCVCSFSRITNRRPAHAFCFLQKEVLRHSYDCCVPSAGSPGPCSSRLCEHSHMGPDPSSKHCQCVTGYTYDPETHTCEGE